MKNTGNKIFEGLATTLVAVVGIGAAFLVADAASGRKLSDYGREALTSAKGFANSGWYQGSPTEYSWATNELARVRAAYDAGENVKAEDLADRLKQSLRGVSAEYSNRAGWGAMGERDRELVLNDLLTLQGERLQKSKR